MTVDVETQVWKARWRDALGPLWGAQLAAIAALLFLAGAAMPLADADLPMHLAMGEWIVKHHAVPHVEPFAWTRAGAPFQAYSWAIERLYYESMAHAGPVGLHVLQGCVYVALAAAILFLGWAARWSPWTTVLMAIGNLIVALAAAPYLRPQSVLLIVIPVVWALVYVSLTGDRIGLVLLGLVAASTALANSHILFPLTAAPCILLLTEPPRDRRRVLFVPLAIVAGWMLSPYGLRLREVFALNFAPNALYGPPTSIQEVQPGFLVLVSTGASSLFMALALAALPWFVGPALTRRSRLLYGMTWLVGLVLFALAARSLVVWWLMVIPSCALALRPLESSPSPVFRTAQRALVHMVFAVVAVQGVGLWLDPELRAGDLKSRYLPGDDARSIEPLAQWLDCFTDPNVRGRLVTTFNYGGYIPWRLSRLSESVDGRVIFPDSVSRPETYLMPVFRTVPVQPWRTADVAIFPATYPVAAVLDTAAGWHRVAITTQSHGRPWIIALWVTDGWWRRAGRIPLPSSALPAMHIVATRKASCVDVSPGALPAD